MAINLVSLVSQFLTPQLVGSLARAVGINEAVAQKLAAAAIPTILAVLASTAAAPGGAQKLTDAISNSDPDVLTKLTAAISGGNVGALNQGASVLGGLLGGSGLSTLAGALSQYAGAPPAASQSMIGAVSQSVIGAIGQQDPSSWSDASSIASLFSSQKDAISAALPPEIARALGTTGLLAGVTGLGAAAAQTAARTAPPTPPPTAPAPAPAAPLPAPAPSGGSGFPTWAIILLIVIVLAAIWWFMSQNQKPAEPAKTGGASPAVEYAATAVPLPPRA